MRFTYHNLDDSLVRLRIERHASEHKFAIDCSHCAPQIFVSGHRRIVQRHQPAFHAADALSVETSSHVIRRAIVTIDPLTSPIMLLFDSHCDKCHNDHSSAPRHIPAAAPIAAVVAATAPTNAEADGEYRQRQCDTISARASTRHRRRHVQQPP